MVTRLQGTAALAAAAVVLGGCMGGDNGGNGGGFTPPGDDERGLAVAANLAAQIRSEADLDGPDGPRIAGLLDDVIAANDAPRPADLPAGSASYAGDIGALNRNGAGMLARLSLDVTFADGTLTGTIDQASFETDGTGVAATGSLPVTGTVAGGDLSATFAGSFTGPLDGATVSADVDGRLDGSFVGADADRAAGSTRFTVSGTDLPGEATGRYDGVFHTRRD